MSKAVEGRMWVRRQFREMGKDVGDGEMEEKRLLVDEFETEPAYAEASMGLTLNLGNYESLRIDIGARIPCYKEELVEAHQHVFRLIESELLRRRREVEETLD